MPGESPVAKEFVEAAGSQLYTNGAVPLLTLMVPAPVALVHVACDVILVTVGFGVVCKIIYFVTGIHPPNGLMFKVYVPGVEVVMLCVVAPEIPELGGPFQIYGFKPVGAVIDAVKAPQVDKLIGVCGVAS